MTTPREGRSSASRTARSQRPGRVRRAAVAGSMTLAAAAGLAVSSTVANAATTAAPQEVSPAPASPPGVPAFDFADCPELPAGVDPKAWRCEVLVATGSLKFGRVEIPALPSMTLTHSEGPMPDGSRGQVWGNMRSAPVPVPGGLLGTPHEIPGLGLTLNPLYGGYSDFYSDGDNMGLFTMKFDVRSPLLPRGCTIGDGEPVEFRLKRVGPPEWVSRMPPVVAFNAADTAFPVPSAKGCGPLQGLLNHRLGLPAATGNSVTYSAHYTYRTYDQLPDIE